MAAAASRFLCAAVGSASCVGRVYFDTCASVQCDARVRAFDDALTLTGLIITKLDGTAKGGVLAAIARERPVPVYFIGVGEKLEELETFNAREFAQALLG